MRRYFDRALQCVRDLGCWPGRGFERLRMDLMKRREVIVVYEGGASGLESVLLPTRPSEVLYICGQDIYAGLGR